MIHQPMIYLSGQKVTRHPPSPARFPIDLAGARRIARRLLARAPRATLPGDPHGRHG
ncbi:hypothetical protein LIG30_1233 [Burkholderia sp. lig30]|jgi:hypothetical protein|uniref:hypothetical protein n=1 Tax=Burkholderia sp. lig30 TaxID=1192124 RepID=UPI000461E7AE|nr:hypothetical protein [Burkholderia sp. lig30]KDB10031.1 hypothetical protein LIG30_1233 [Burkholderia sp. lig30]